MGRTKERIRPDRERILRPTRAEGKNQKKQNEVAGNYRPEGFGRDADAVAGFGCVFLAAGREHRRCGWASPKPARNRLDSRMRVRNPSINGGIASCGTPRIRKRTSAASPGASTLEPMPTPCTPDCFINSSTRALCTTFARESSLSDIA